MKIFITGGVRSGKSSLAQKLAMQLSTGNHYYVATMIPTDADDLNRIQLHLSDRQGMGFQTIEQGRGIENCLEKMEPSATVLLDSITALLMNELYLPENDYAPDESAAQRISDGLKTVADSVDNVVFVSDYLFSDAARYDASTERFRSSLGRIHCFLAQICDTVLEVSSAQIIIHKGGLPQ